ncbi:MAG: pectate lyase [Planctomycetota bacterium]|jgi:PelA/Pel-15E family pectate lyase
MKKSIRGMVIGLLCLFTGAMVFGAQGVKKPVKVVSWGRCLSQRGEFYTGDEAIRIADNVLLYQRSTGGWAKGIDMARVLSDGDKAHLRSSKNRQDSILDNGATHTQIRYLAKVYDTTRLERFKRGFLKGVDYLFRAQYDNGGWPQSYPNPSGYSRYITFNDHAMIGAMSVLRDIAEKKPGYTFVDEGLRERSEKAVQKGIECILKCQIIVDGERTAWCQQHDEKTFAPRPARTYEKISICGGESVGVIKFLMSIDNPTPQIIEAIQSAVAWFDRVKLTGIRQINKPDQSERGFDNVIIKDATAPPVWARFYQIGTNRPLFCGRDGKIKYSLAEIEHERRTGYSWYGRGPAELLNRDYPIWQKKWAPKKNVLIN